MEMVIGLYERGFVHAFDSYPRVSMSHNIISYFGLWAEHLAERAPRDAAGAPERFADAQAEQLAAAIVYVAEHCSFPDGPLRISAEGNGFSAAGKLALRNAAEPCAGIEALYL
jgi:hypothetical protein